MSEEQACLLMKNSLVIDGLIASSLNENLVKHIISSGYTVGNYTCGSSADDTTQAMFKMEAVRWLVDYIPDNIFIVENFKDIEKAKEQGKFGVIMGFQGAEPIGNKFHMLSIFWRLGLRILGLTYSQRNLLGDGCLEPENRGLSHFGIQVVRDCNNLGIVVDLSHTSIRTSMDAIELSEKPCIFSHSNPATLQKNPRNVTDEQMKKIAKREGVVCLAAFSDFVGNTKNGRHPKIEELIRQIDYTVNLIGIDHVGVGTDILIGGGGHWWNNNTKRRYPETTGGMSYDRHEIVDFQDFSGFTKTVTQLLERGYVEEDIKKIIGGNLYRVFQEVLPRQGGKI